jgi:hypothetical protein
MLRIKDCDYLKAKVIADNIDKAAHLKMVNSAEWQKLLFLRETLLSVRSAWEAIRNQ